MKGDSDIGLIGMGVMGENLIMNMNDHGFLVSCWNRTTSKVDDFMDGSAKGSKVRGFHELSKFVSSLKSPRRVMLMIKAGQPVDDIISELLPLLEKGDIIIDGGNSYFPDTERRCSELKTKGIHFVGMGVSGGEEGARFGPSLMPGGAKEAWPHIKSIFQTIAAKAENGEPCADWVGEGGSGHFVKMVHNGIEYGDIQLICEAYDLLHRVLACTEKELADIFTKWNKTELDSYLIEITSHVFTFSDVDGKPMLDKILDVAGQKGTGKWTAQQAFEEGVPLTLIGEAVFARSLSSMKEERVKMSKLYKHHHVLFTGDKVVTIEEIRKALYASKIVSYAQGYMLMREASKRHNWNLNFGAIALMWRNGCIIRSAFLGEIKKAFDKNPHLTNLLFDEFFLKEVFKSLEGWRETILLAVRHSIPIPCMGAALSWFDGMTSEKLPANLLQAIRDYFGAHTYERVDKPRGQFFHSNWTGHGGTTASGSYNA